MRYPQEMAGAKRFMNGLGAEFTDQKRAFIVVLHINPTSVPLINELSQRGRIAGVIAKPNSINFATYEGLADKYRFLDLDKHRMLEKGAVERYIAPLTADDEKLVIIDIGGYFAGALPDLNELPNLAGVVEDTENGLQKYERALERYPENKVPLFSIARSRSKDFEDYLIGRSIAYSTIRALRKEAVKDWRSRKIGIIGFGEVGRGAAFYLKDNLGLEVSIYDHNPEVQKKIGLSGFMAEERAALLKSSEILIAATGRGSLHDEDISVLKKGCYIASCTSADDEFAFNGFNLEGIEASQTGTVTISGVHFINGGNAVNFMHPEQLENLLSPYIYLTHSALLKSAVEIDRSKGLKTSEINVLSEASEKKLIGDFRRTLSDENKNSAFINKFLLSGLGR